MVIDVIQQALLFFPLICAIYFSYLVLKITDVSVDGTVVLGAAIAAKLLLSGVNAIAALFLAMTAGFIVGICVGLIQYKDGINDIISGLLMSFMLYSINLSIMGKPNLMVMHTDNLLTLVKEKKFLLVFISSSAAAIYCILIMRSKVGLKLRSFGINRNLMTRLGFHTEFFRMIGLGISGSLAALNGAILSQTYGYSDINMGAGMAITGIGALVMGLHLSARSKFLRKKLSDYHIMIELLSCFIGIFCYFSVTNVLILLEVNPTHFKLILALTIIAFLKLSKKSGAAN